MTAPYVPPGVDPADYSATLAVAKKTGQAQPVFAGGRLLMYVDGEGRPQNPPTADAKSGGGGGASQPAAAAGKPAATPAPAASPQDSNLKPGTYTLNDGAQLTVRPDGSRIVVRPDGRRLVLDSRGNVVDTGDPNAGKGRTSLSPTTGKTATEDKWDQKDNAPQIARTKQNEDASAALNLNSAQQAQGWVFVNGQRMKVTAVDAKGNPTALSYENSAVDPKTGQPTGKLSSVSTVFNALNLTDIPNASAAFLMSRGATDVNTGAAPNPNNPRLGDHGSLANTVADGHQMLSISNGLEWYANLATLDPATYAEMTTNLAKAGYASNSVNTAVFTADAAHAMALAMRDVSIVNSRPGGGDMTLPQFLEQGAAAAKKDARAKGAAAYQPVNRSYTDPAALHAQAKAAAQAALGRALTDAESKKFEDAFHGQESAMYNAVDSSGRAQAGAAAAGESAAGASFTRPDASGEADAYLESPEFEQERAGTAIGSYAQVLQKMVGL